MSGSLLTSLWRLQTVFQAFAMAAVGLVTVALCLTFALSMAGVAPALDVTLTLSDGTSFAAGPIIHGAAALVGLVLLAYMPANWRMRRLEAAHRSFRVGMEDVTRAYHAAHAADRAGTFQFSSEYDAVRERMSYLANHPDLGHLEPDILELAAQMSRVSEDIAMRYSDEAVARAKSFLSERQAEIARMETRVEEALAVARDIRRWNDRVEIAEDVVKSRIDVLTEELDRLLPDLGLRVDRPPRRPEVIHLSDRTSSSGVAAE